MKLEFDLNEIRMIEFGVGRDDHKGQTFCLAAVDGSVQQALTQMGNATWKAMQELTTEPPLYDPSEKYDGTEYVYLPLIDNLAKPVGDLHEANNLPMDTNALEDSENVFCYFARMVDTHGRRLTGLRRATQFKGLLRKHLMRFVSDAFKLIEDRVFKMDKDFDLLSDARNVHILRPNGFVFAGKLQEALLAAAPENVKAIQHDLSFVDFEGIEAYAQKHPRAARYLASIRSQKETKGIDKAALKTLCKRTGVEVHESHGKLTVPDGQVLGFLEVLDRRRYEVELVKASPERFRAPSRRRIET